MACIQHSRLGDLFYVTYTYYLLRSIARRNKNTLREQTLQKQG
jgi:hypothetical protein